METSRAGTSLIPRPETVGPGNEAKLELPRELRLSRVCLVRWGAGLVDGGGGTVRVGLIFPSLG